jgi:hypothetical protein
MIADGDEEHTSNFVFERRVFDLVPLVKNHPQIEAVLIDDMTSIAASKGFTPQHLIRLLRVDG